MFRKKTVFILGAGASVPYGYPTGKELISKITRAIESDSIFVPQKDYIDIFEVKFDFLANHFADFKAHDFFGLKQSSDSSTQQIKLSSIRKLYESVVKEIRFADISEFKALKNGLEKHHPVSIDNFLKKHDQHQEAGKVMIVYEILKCESSAQFANLSNEGDWYPLLLDKVSLCDQPTDIKNNKLNIITFNYDVGLPYYLRDRLNDTSFFNQSKPNESKSPAEDFLENYFPLKSENHVYGKLHEEIENKESFKFSGYGFEDLLKGKDDRLKNMIRLFNAYRLKDNISVIGGDKSMAVAKEEKERLEKIIKEAEEVFILGFGFDERNLELLGLPNSLCFFGKQDFDSQKTILWHNFKGENKSILRSLNQFFDKNYGRNRRNVSCVLEFIDSDADNIEKALSNDLMTPF